LSYWSNILLVHYFVGNCWIIKQGWKKKFLFFWFFGFRKKSKFQNYQKKKMKLKDWIFFPSFFLFLSRFMSLVLLYELLKKKWYKETSHFNIKKEFCKKKIFFLSWIFSFFVLFLFPFHFISFSFFISFLSLFFLFLKFLFQKFSFNITQSPKVPFSFFWKRTQSKKKKEWVSEMFFWLQTNWNSSELIFFSFLLFFEKRILWLDLEKEKKVKIFLKKELQRPSFWKKNFHCRQKKGFDHSISTKMKKGDCFDFVFLFFFEKRTSRTTFWKKELPAQSKKGFSHSFPHLIFISFQKFFRFRFLFWFFFEKGTSKPLFLKNELQVDEKKVFSF